MKTLRNIKSEFTKKLPKGAKIEEIKWLGKSQKVTSTEYFKYSGAGIPVYDKEITRVARAVVTAPGFRKGKYIITATDHDFYGSKWSARAV